MRYHDSTKPWVSPKLSAVTHDDSMPKVRTWCGPSVVAAFSGQPIEHVAHWLWTRRGNRNGNGTARGVRSTGTSELRAALGAAGFNTGMLAVAQTDDGKAPTLAYWLRKRTPDQRKRAFVINVGEHWVAVRGNKFVDSFTLDPVFIRKAPHRRARVRRIIEVRKPKLAKRKKLMNHLPAFQLTTW